MRNLILYTVLPNDFKISFFTFSKTYDKTRQHIKKQRHYFVNKGLYSLKYDYSNRMYGYESWTLKQAECQRTDALNSSVEDS